MEFDLAKIAVGEQERAIARCGAVLAEQRLSLPAEKVRALLAERDEHLSRMQRIERGAGVLPELLKEFAPSPYLMQQDLPAQLSCLQESFYAVRAEAPLCVSDSDILCALRRAFEDAVGGDAEVLVDLDPREVLAFLEEPSDDAEEGECDSGVGWSEDGGAYRIADDAGRVYVFDSQAWRDDVLAPGWFGENWDDGDIARCYERDGGEGDAR